MTYLIGLHQPDFNAIICDSRISWKENNSFRGRNESLKTGLLFNGGVFGRLGNDVASRDFVTDYKKKISGLGLTPEEAWGEFEKFSSSYAYSREKKLYFELLISERSSGIPKFFLLKAGEGLTEQKKDAETYLMTYGSGKPFLDLYVNPQFDSRLLAIRQKLQQLDASTVPNKPLILPYPLCLWLSELSLSFEKGHLEEKFAVGGVFHFVYQTPDSEATQQPSLYILSGAEETKKRIYSWVFRVVYDGGFLMVDEHNPLDKTVKEIALLDESSRPGISALDERQLQELFNHTQKKAPYYSFCGFGFTDPAKRNGFLMTFSPNGKKEDLFDTQGFLLPKWSRFLEQNFERK